MITPVFALDAEELFEIGQYTDAVALCKQGLELYPEYASGYAVLYKALLALEHISEALSCLEKGLTFLPSNRILVRLLNEHHDKYGLLYIDELPEFPAVFEAEEINTTTVSEVVNIDELSEEFFSEPDFEAVREESDIINTVPRSTENITDDNIDHVELTEQQTFTEGALAEVVTTEEVFVERPFKNVQPETHFRNEKVSSTPMRVIENAEQGEKVLIRASSIGLIPGLQFVPITLRKPARRFSSELPELPAFREFRKPKLPAIKELTSTVKARTPLEELAARLEKARVAIVQEDTPTVHDTKDVEIVTPATETVAKIYETQGAYSQAVRVYEELIRSKPESASKYEELIRKIRNKPDVKKTR